MASKAQLETLMDLARRETDDAAKRLGASLKAVDEAKQKHQMLVGYREEYAKRFEAAQQAGITPMAYRNFQAFMEKLDVAVKGQQDMIKHAEYRSEQEKAAWQASERKRMSYSTLNDRADAEALKLENKRDQKQMDEHAARQAYYKR
ncbi:flagellar export protein FliJ [Duganella sp. BJB488]|uniref:Flagellar FliJ protein n=1 Tax=Duganella vulcania TaxID=2692166 RepID=A0A845HUB6_9BURK|nr:MULTISPECIES: flagellar export protein FliJ [Duganella]MYN20989.1 flagellar export protein FliJ [Duganella vulcania]NVD73833.1 flagellar export protein FliJ [Duganella sp. BJB1802]RFP25881.1 flagellar export protein FliJ [Duganella sp. BJB489]RFP28378.1 flagellar export protein FliJ [Duganella sp. BJB488]RFP36811.1 flagellar export protein FliJ [Duganella sp. BJB480]